VLGQRYLAVLRDILTAVEEDELPKLEGLADRIAEGIAAGGAFYVYDNGHMLNTELFNRAGGLALLAPVPVVRLPAPPEGRRRAGAPLVGDEAAEGAEDERALARISVRRAGLRPGDVLLLGSVSGRSPMVVEMALAAKAQGAYVVALTALAYARVLPPLHPAGRLLYQVVDLVLDTHTREGDAELHVDGLPYNVLPSSGISAAAVAWCLVGELVERLLARGLAPTVFRSVNYPDGPERYQEALVRYRRLGY